MHVHYQCVISLAFVCLLGEWYQHSPFSFLGYSIFWIPVRKFSDWSLENETSVDLWSDITAMEYPSPHILRLLYSSFLTEKNLHIRWSAAISMFTVFFSVKKELYNKQSMCGDGYSMTQPMLGFFLSVLLHFKMYSALSNLWLIKKHMFKLFAFYAQKSLLKEIERKDKPEV